MSTKELISKARSYAVVIAVAASLAPDAVEAGRAARAPAVASYVIEFRSRPDEWGGHGHVVARTIDRSGRIAIRRVAGFWPDPEVGSVLLAIGAPGVVRATPDDLRLAPTEVFAVPVARSRFERALATIDRIARQRPAFDPFTGNCNTLLGHVARSAGLRAPASYFQLPDSYVARMRDMNAPLKGRDGSRRPAVGDAGSSLPSDSGPSVRPGPRVCGEPVPEMGREECR